MKLLNKQWLDILSSIHLTEHDERYLDRWETHRRTYQHTCNLYFTMNWSVYNSLSMNQNRSLIYLYDQIISFFFFSALDQSLFWMSPKYWSNKMMSMKKENHWFLRQILINWINLVVSFSSKDTVERERLHSFSLETIPMMMMMMLEKTSELFSSECV